MAEISWICLFGSFYIGKDARSPSEINQRIVCDKQISQRRREKSVWLVSSPWSSSSLSLLRSSTWCWPWLLWQDAEDNPGGAAVGRTLDLDRLVARKTGYRELRLGVRIIGYDLIGDGELEFRLGWGTHLPGSVCIDLCRPHPPSFCGASRWNRWPALIVLN